MVTGNRNILNSIKGITSVVKLTAEEKTALADRVLPANVLVVDSSNIVYLTDGVTAVKALNPLLASSNNYAYDKDVVHLTGDETIAGTKTFSAAIVGSVTGNAGSATKLATARTINGTSFNGTTNITTANWGTARNISITDGTNTSTAVSVNGSANVSLNLPATIKANLTGNAATATKATQDAAGNTITTTYATKAENNTKANDSDVVHKSGDETIAGTKTFSNGVLSTAPNALMAQRGEYTLVLRNDGRDTYLLMSDKDGAPGTFSSARPLRINNPTGVCDINGNAATATKLATARTIALSGAATGTATGFNGTANIAIPVTSLDASKLTGTASVSTTGNAATATTATNATNAAKLDNIASSGYVQTGKVNQTINGTKTFSAAIASSIKTNTYIDGNKGVAIINSTAPAGYNMLYRIKSTNGVFTGGVFNQNYELHYTVDTTIAANTNAVTYTTTLMNEAGDATFAKNVTIGVGLTVKGDANFANITASYITGLFTE